MYNSRHLGSYYTTSLHLESQCYTRNLKSPAVVRQKLFTVPTRSVILEWGRMSPLRRMRWPVQVQTNNGGRPQGLQRFKERYFTEVLLGGKALVKRAHYTSFTP
jgi:hypothetical protein